MNYKKKAEKYLNQAENLLSPKGFFSRIIGPKRKKAMKMYRKAGAHFKAVNLYTNAAMAFMAAAKIYENDTNEKFRTAKNFVDAGCCYCEEFPADALKAYRKGIDIFVEIDLLDYAVIELRFCGFICQEKLNDEKRANDFHQEAEELSRKHHLKQIQGDSLVKS